MTVLPTTKASAAGTPIVAPRHFARQSTASIDRECGQGLISKRYSSKALIFRVRVSEILTNQFGWKATPEPGVLHSVLDGISKYSSVCTGPSGVGLQAVATDS